MRYIRKDFKFYKIYENFKNLKSSILVILLLLYIFTLPFNKYIPRMPFMPFISITVFLKILIVLILVGEVAIRRKKFVEDKANLILLLFLVFAFISILWAEDLGWAFEYLKKLIHVILLYFLIINIFTEKKLIKSALFFLFIGGIISAIIGLFQYFFQTGLLGGRVIGSFLDPNEFSVFLSLIIPINFFFLNENINFFKKIFLYFCFFILLLPIFLTYSRTGLITLSIILLLLFLRSKKKIYWIILGLVIINLFGIVVLVHPNNILKETFRTNSISQRIRIFGYGTKLFLNNFVFGVGLGNFRVQFVDYVGGGGFYGFQERIAHNTYLDIASELGIIGLFLFFYFIWLIFKKKFTCYNQSSLLYTLWISFVGLLVASLFLSFSYFTMLWLLFFSSLLIAYEQSKDINNKLEFLFTDETN